MSKGGDQHEKGGLAAAGRVRLVLGEELETLHLRVLVANAVARLLPKHTCTRARTRVLRMGGWDIDPTTLFAQAPHFSGSGPIQQRLRVGAGGWINVGCTFELNDTITIDDRVNIGPDVLVLTSTHKLGSRLRRAGSHTSAPVHVCDGAWIGARAVVLPGVTIGEGAVVSSGAVVSKDVPANSLVAGAPAQVIVKRLPG